MVERYPNDPLYVQLAAEIIRQQNYELGRSKSAYELDSNKLFGAVDELQRISARMSEDYDSAQSDHCLEKTNAKITDVHHNIEHLAGLWNKARRVEIDCANQVEWHEQKTRQLDQNRDEIDRLDFDLHLHALNAIVQAERLGEEGKGVQVLADEINRISVQYSEALERLGGFHDRIRETTGQLNLIGDSESIETELKTTSAFISGSRNTVEETLGRAGQSIMGLKHVVIRLMTEVGDVAKIYNWFDHTCRQYTHTATAIVKLAGTPQDNADARSINALVNEIHSKGNRLNLTVLNGFDVDFDRSVSSAKAEITVITGSDGGHEQELETGQEEAIELWA